MCQQEQGWQRLIQTSYMRLTSSLPTSSLFGLNLRRLSRGVIDRRDLLACRHKNASVSKYQAYTG